MKLKKTEYLYFLGLFLLCLTTWEFISNVINFTDTLRMGLYVITAGCFAINMFECKYKQKEFCIMMILLIISFYSTYKMHEINFFIDYLAIISSKNISNKKIVRFFLYFNLTLILMHIFLQVAGIVVNQKIYETFIGGIYRETFNMRHPNYLAATLFWTLSCYLYLAENKTRVVKIIILFIVMLISYYLTYSRTSLLLYIFMAILIFIKNKKIQNIIMDNAKYVVIFFTVLSIVLAYNYFSLSDNIKDIVTELNNKLSGRLYLNALAVKVYNPTILGENIYSLTYEIFTIDSFYISLWVYYGIIHLLILIFAFIKYENKNKNYYEYIFLLMIFIVALTERYVIYITIVFPLFFLKSLLFKTNDDVEHINK